MVLKERFENTSQVVDYFIRRFMRVPPADEKKQVLVQFLNKELGTSKISAAQSYMEEPLRLLLHLIMSEPEYQLG
jgi:hypothetical protein